jgi:hypothetical protein
MHKHLKQQLTPADHVNTELSAGLAEIIELAMQKDRDDRYASTEEMLEDLEVVRRHEPPPHAHKNVSLETLAKIEETGKTVDIVTPPQPDLWGEPLVVGLLISVGICVVAIGILLVLLLTKS